MAVYWISTGLVTAMLLASSASYIFHDVTIQGVRDLGFPDFFRIQLAILKVIAVIVLLAPQASVQMKEWAYAGAALFIITAMVAHYAHDDPWVLNALNVAFLTLLGISNYHLPR